MQQVRDIGHYPKESRRGSAEQQLAEQIRRARKAKQFSPEQEAELEALQQTERDARTEARIADAEGPPNLEEGFAEEAENRIDQELLMLESGTRSKELLRRLAVYKEVVSSALAHHEEFVRRYAERVRQASVIRNSEVDGDELRVFSGRHIIRGSLVCQLCESDFLTEEEKAAFKTSFEIDQRWLLEFAADRAPFIDQAQSLNLFIPADVDKWDLMMLHFQAWEKGIKSLYYLRSKSVQRAGFAGGVEADNTADAAKYELAAGGEQTDYEECLACQ